jgi:hypothetical protein
MCGCVTNVQDTHFQCLISVENVKLSLSLSLSFFALFVSLKRRVCVCQIKNWIFFIVIFSQIIPLFQLNPSGATPPPSQLPRNTPFSRNQTERDGNEQKLTTKFWTKKQNKLDYTRKDRKKVMTEMNRKTEE